jgi:hypothetical protein
MKRSAVLVLSALVAAGLFAVAFWMGAAYFDIRRTDTHAGRLERLLKKTPTLAQVTAGLEDEGSPLVASPEGEDALRAAARQYGRQKQAEVLAKGGRYAKTRVFRAGDMIYFLYFDADDVMRDFTFVSA